MPPETPALSAPPPFCQYADGPCDQVLHEPRQSSAFFVYPSIPAVIAATIEESIQSLRRAFPDRLWLSWKDMGISGQIVLCEVCKALRSTQLVVADVTTLNFNLLFEMGYALSLRLPILPIRDTSYVKDQKLFDELGLLDTFGYLDFRNSRDLSRGIQDRLGASPLSLPPVPVNTEQPLYLVKSHIYNEGMVKLMSALKKSGLRFRSFDPRETSRLSLHEALKQVFSSLGVVVHLVSPEREGALTHNSRCAFLAGIAMGAGKHVLMLQETRVQQPIDYRDVVRSYSNAAKVPDLLIPLITQVVGKLQESRFIATALPLTVLEKVDLGDVAAENEIKALRSYFVPTGQYNEAKRGHARLVVGRKGAGKTAIFYGVRSAYLPSPAHLVLDLKPEGHQFVKLREAVLKELSPGLQQHVLTAFWNYLLLMELAHKIVNTEVNLSYRDPRLREPYERVRIAYGNDRSSEQGDFSERLLTLVDDIVARRRLVSTVSSAPHVTQVVYSHDIRSLSDALSEYLSKKEDVWLLFDNLDKGWPAHGAVQEDILLLRSLLEATRKLQRQFETRGVEFHAVVFIRNDIYSHLVLETPDRGKDTAIMLSWDDSEVFKEILRRRICFSAGVHGTFEELWPLFFASHVRGEESFSYMLGRTLMRPREMLAFARECIDVAVNRGHEKVQEADILQAERSYSENALVDISSELKDVATGYADVPYAFIGTKTTLSRGQVDDCLLQAGVAREGLDRVVDLLLWFGFLGFHAAADEERYSYQFQHDMKRMRGGLGAESSYCIHPAFRSVLGCEG